MTFNQERGASLATLSTPVPPISPSTVNKPQSLTPIFHFVHNVHSWLFVTQYSFKQCTHWRVKVKMTMTIK